MCVIMISLNNFYDQIELLFYKYGLFSSRHPISMICFSAVMILSCCYPLINLPIPGREPQQFFTTIEDLQETNNIGTGDSNVSMDVPFWFSSNKQTAYIQQFIVKVITDPATTKEFAPNTAFKASLNYVFPLLDEIKAFSIDQNLSVSHSCFPVSQTVIKKKQRIKSIFPEEGCLLISPAAYWKNQQKLFASDANIQKTIDQYESKTIKAPPSIKELLFGLPSEQSKTKTKPFIVTFAITLALKAYNVKVIQGLKNRLHKLYSPPDFVTPQKDCQVHIHSKNGTACTNLSQTVTHIRYYSQMRFKDLVLLLSSYFGIGCYIYFSVKKINFVKSKLGMALCAVVSVLATLMVAVGLCSLIGLTPTLTGGQTFPYLVCFIGLENILVITKSVVTTHTHLDVDKRIAVGLCREGSSIIKNLLLEFFIVGLGFFNIFVPAIKEFCAFAIIGICSDFFINMLFFVPVLSIDIKRLDNEDPYESTSAESECSESESVYPHLSRNVKKRKGDQKHCTSKRKRVDSVEDGGKTPILKIPRRLRLVFFFADTRMIQRGLMVFMVLWFSFLVYRDPAGILTDQQGTSRDQSYEVFQVLDAMSAEEQVNAIGVGTNSIKWTLKDIFSFHSLSFRHWPTLFSYYNISLAKQYVSILPSVFIPITLPQSSIEDFQETKAKGLFHMEILNFHLPENAYYQITGFDYYLTLIIGAVSGILMLLLLNFLYHCICSRNYANSTSVANTYSTSLPFGSVPLLLSGHKQMVDCVHVEGVAIISIDISGELRTWDSHSGECTSLISRKRVLNEPHQADMLHGALTLKEENEKFDPVWSLATAGQYIYLGCADGRLEVWDIVSGTEQCKHVSSNGGIVGLAYEENRLVAARITGTLDFFDVEENYIQQQATSSDLLLNPVSNVKLQLVYTVKSAHQLPISAFDMSTGRILTGSCDHTIKLFSLKDAKCQFTMFGHTGPVTVLNIEKKASIDAVSGSKDGTVRLWNLISGLCTQVLLGHQSSVAVAQCSAHYVVSTAQDDTLCMWERKSGTLLHTKNLNSICCNAVSLFGENLYVTGGKGDLILWNIKNGDLLCRIPLSNGSLMQPTVRQVHVSSDFCVVCVLGHELSVARFPVVLENM